MDERFVLTGIRPAEPEQKIPVRRRHEARRAAAGVFLAAVVLGCLFCRAVMTKDPTYMDLANCTHRPDREFLFGTDTMGRDIFSMIWYGGRISLSVGFLATVLSTCIAVAVGALSGMAPPWLDGLIMRLTDILLSIPSLLAVILLQAALGRPGVVSISLVIGATSWMSIAKIIRTEVRQMRQCGYILAARCMGGGFFHLLRRHLAPNFLPAVMFMVVMNVRGAIAAESTLSFLGVGLPPEVVSWGGMLSLAGNALTSGAWWIILIPGLFLVSTLLAVTELGDSLRRAANKKQSNL